MTPSASVSTANTTAFIRTTVSARRTMGATMIAVILSRRGHEGSDDAAVPGHGHGHRVGVAADGLAHRAQRRRARGSGRAGLDHDRTALVRAARRSLVRG